jgi:hypothetical protein
MISFILKFFLSIVIAALRALSLVYLEESGAQLLQNAFHAELHRLYRPLGLRYVNILRTGNLRLMNNLALQ